MDKVTAVRLKRDLQSVCFERDAPANNAEYWLFGAPAASMKGLRALPSLLGLEWSWQGDELVIDFIDGLVSGESDLLTWPEFAGVAAEGSRLLGRWTGFRLPVRVLVCPGLGVRIAMEHMDEGESQKLHRHVVEGFIPKAIVGMQKHAVLVGCDTRGITCCAPEGLLGYGTGPSDSLLIQDYVLTHTSLAQSSVATNPHQVRQVYGELCLISASGRAR